MPEYVGLIKYPLAGERYNTGYGEPQWWRDLAVTAQAEMKEIAYPKAAPAGVAATDLAPGVWNVSNPANTAGLPAGVGPGVLTREGDVDSYQETGTLSVRWERRLIAGSLSQWTKVTADALIPHALTRPLAALTENITSRSVRIPFRVPVRARRWRVVIRNANYRTNTAYPGAVTLRTVAIGGQARDADGNLTSSFAPTSTFPSGLRLLIADRAVPDMGAGWSSGIASGELLPGVDYMLSYGYQTDGQDIHLGMGGGWQTNGSPTNAALLNDGTAASVTRQPFDVRLEYVTDDMVQQDIVIGDSIGAGSNATFPVMEAPLATADRVAGRATRLASFGGAAFGEWIGVNWGDPASMKWQDITQYGRTDRAVIALGNNDIHADANLSTLQANLKSLLALVRSRLSSTVVVCTVTPRTAWVGTGKESVRVAFNDWLRAYPEGVGMVADTARAVEDATGHAPRADYVTSDGIHFNSAGSTALANAILEARVKSLSDGGSAEPAPEIDWSSAIDALNAAAS